jgi:hypothetical protein
MSRIPLVVLLASLLTLATGWPLVYSGEKGTEFSGASLSAEGETPAPAKGGLPPMQAWIVIKFRGQKETSAGMAFYNTSRVPPVDVILSHGTYFKDLKAFREKMKKDRPELKLFIWDEAHFKSSGFDSTIFQGFEDKFIDAKGRGPADAPKETSAEDLLFPLPPQEVAAGKFEQWAREAVKQPSSTTYTRVEYDRKAYWVVETIFGYGDPSEKIAVYAPTKGGSFRRCLLAGPIKASGLAIALDAKTGVLSLREEADSSRKGEVVLSCNLKAVGVLP